MRRLLSVLIVFAIAGGPASQPAHAAHPAPQATTEDMPCDMGMSAGDTDDHKPLMPCKGSHSDCMKQVCCAANAVLPVPAISVEHGIPLGAVSYWSFWSSPAGLNRIPESLPPRTI